MSASAAGVVLTSNNAGTDSSGVFWRGGKTALILVATAYGSTVKLQVQGPDASNTWVDINATTFSANQCTVYDLPAGQYRMHITGGTTTALYASLVAAG